MIAFSDFLEINNIKNKDAAKAMQVKDPMVSQWKHDPRVKLNLETGELIRVSVIKRNALKDLKSVM